MRIRKRRLALTVRLDRRNLELARLEIGQLARRFGVPISTVKIRLTGDGEDDAAALGLAVRK